MSDGQLCRLPLPALAKADGHNVQNTDASESDESTRDDRGDGIKSFCHCH
jgi:hypothetical protein